MPDVAGDIGHGGFGTTMTALAAGVPQLVILRFASDQFLNADLVAAEIPALADVASRLPVLGELAALSASRRDRTGPDRTGRA